EIGERAEDRIDIAVICNVIAEIGHGRGIEGRDPDGRKAEIGEVVEPCGDAGEIADAVTIRVLERARIDLIDEAGLPPAHRTESTPGSSLCRPIQARLSVWVSRPGPRPCRR